MKRTFVLALATVAVAAAAVSLPASSQQGAQSWPSPGGGTKVVTTASGLQYYDMQVGKGPQPAQGSTVQVHYTGWLLSNKQKFDSSLDAGKPFEFALGTGQVIRGWDEGVATMKVGGRRRLVVPPQLGYGAKGFPGAIPPNSTLVFDVQLLKFQ